MSLLHVQAPSGSKGIDGGARSFFRLQYTFKHGQAALGNDFCRFTAPRQKSPNGRFWPPK
jgi:hypothetical protein